MTCVFGDSERVEVPRTSVPISESNSTRPFFTPVQTVVQSNQPLFDVL
jgi:hypothetical protein